MQTNELYRSGNPYLLQHKDNPVAWKMWGKEAFDEARERNVPVLVSIGYSTCHWCHVMAHEVFENQEIADVMNDHLVCIKVDREEHPEVDEVYMEACQAMNGSGGWPLNVFTDHDGRPFFAATYVPGDNWKNLVLKISEAWNRSRTDLDRYASSLSEALQESEIRKTGKDEELKDVLFRYLREQYDDKHPDFSGRSPRFPSHTLYYYLLSMRQLPQDIATKLEQVLEAIQDSGLHDRVGGGFHRYSTDREWRVPHFEKMLYDNAQMMINFSLAASRFNRIDFLDAAENTASYLIRDLAVYENNVFMGFASAEDADDPNGEGSFYAWTPKELERILGRNKGENVAAEWDVHESNENIHGVYPSRIPHPRGSEIFRSLNDDEKMNLRSEWEPYYNLLLNNRLERPRPFRDDKILTDWNALALTGLTILYAHTGKSIYLTHAEDLAKALTAGFTDGQLQRLPGIKGHITDYGHLALGLFTLWETTCNSGYLNTATDLVKSAFERFLGSNGVLYTSEETSGMFMRFEEKYDHSQPAGSNTLLLAWVRLRALGRLKEYEENINVIFERKHKAAALAPIMVPSFLQVLHEYHEGPLTISIPGDFCENAKDLLKWTGTEIRLIPGEGDIYQFCEKDRCLMPSHSADGLELEFRWKK